MAFRLVQSDFEETGIVGIIQIVTGPIEAEQLVSVKVTQKGGKHDNGDRGRYRNDEGGRHV